ncbi:MAG TPA: MFS transporter [Bacillota bacterium]
MRVCRADLSSRLLGFSPVVLDPRTRRNLAIDAISGSLYGIHAGALLPFIAVAGIRLGASNATVGVITAAPYIGYLTSIFWGQVSQSRAKLPWVVWPTIIGRLALIMVAFTRDPWVYAVIVLLYNFLIAIPGPAMTGLMEKIYPANYRGRLLAAVRVAIGVTFSVFSFLAGRALDAFGHRLLFPVAALVGVGSISLFSRVSEPPEEEGKPARTRPAAARPGLREQLAAIKSDRRFLTHLCGFMLFGAGNLLVAPLYPIFQVRELHLSYSQVAILSVTWSVAWLAAFRGWGQVADRLRPTVPLIAGVVGYALAALIYSRADSLGPLILAHILIGQSDAGLEIGWLSEVMLLAQKRTSVYFGLHYTLMGLRGATIPFLSTALLPVLGMRPMFSIGAAVIVIGLVPILLADRMNHQATSGGGAALTGADQ